MRFRPAQRPAEKTEDAQFQARYREAVQKFAAALKTAAAANAELEGLAGLAGLDLATRAGLPGPWPELRLGTYRGTASRLSQWLQVAKALGFL